MIRIILLSLCFCILLLADLDANKSTEPSSLILVHIVSNLHNARQHNRRYRMSRMEHGVIRFCAHCVSMAVSALLRHKGRPYTC